MCSQGLGRLHNFIFRRPSIAVRSYLPGGSGRTHQRRTARCTRAVIRGDSPSPCHTPAKQGDHNPFADGLACRPSHITSRQLLRYAPARRSYPERWPNQNPCPQVARAIYRRCPGPWTTPTMALDGLCGTAAYPVSGRAVRLRDLETSSMDPLLPFQHSQNQYGTYGSMHCILT